MRTAKQFLKGWLALSVTSLVCLTAPAGAVDWPMWRGPDADGVSAETELPSTWSPEGENLRWKRPIGGRSTPIVVDGRVCIITLAEPDTPSHWQEQISCFDAETGDLRWEFRYKVFLTDIPHHRVG
ncbi:MAG: pyrrolo-quinoline quinone, partial [Acidobacteria bacterium]|nr:pyrrolo-quinoline quinone [Acidobacteriota bacterium]